MNPSQLINQTSGNCEWYTPQFIIDAAREVMGVIDLDPASSFAANKRVGATKFFGYQEDGSFIDGLEQPWIGKVFLNHPFSRVGNPKWIGKLIDEHELEQMQSACCITYACTSEKWFKPLLHQLQCFLSPRTNYYLPDGTVKRGVTKGSVVTYWGQQPDKFAGVFSDYGIVK